VRRLISLLVLAACLPAAALAADPSGGKVSADAPEATWAGNVTSESALGALPAVYAEAGGTKGTCEAPACDAYALEVGEGGTALTVSAAGATEDDWVALELEDPSGKVSYVYEATSSAEVRVDAPAPGAYAVRVVGAPATPNTDMDYTAKAVLQTPAPPTIPEPAPTPAPTPGPDAPPAATPQPKAAPPAAVHGARTLAGRADVRRLDRAVDRGLRVRTVCGGGCTKVKVRVYVSPLTGRQAGISDGRSGEVEVARAPVARNALGRHMHTATFKPSMRRALARLRRLTVAVETTATDPDGRTRTSLHRLALRR
jgi:hypothetical protein